MSLKSRLEKIENLRAVQVKPAPVRTEEETLKWIDDTIQAINDGTAEPIILPPRQPLPPDASHTLRWLDDIIYGEG